MVDAVFDKVYLGSVGDKFASSICDEEFWRAKFTYDFLADKLADIFAGVLDQRLGYRASVDILDFLMMYFLKFVSFLGV